MTDMRSFLDLVTDDAPATGGFAFLRTLHEHASAAIEEGDVISLDDKRQERCTSCFQKGVEKYGNALGSIVDGMRADFSAHGGKYAKLLKLFTANPSKENRLYFMVDVEFRHYKMTPEARAAAKALRAKGFKNLHAGEKYDDNFRGTPPGPFFRKTVTAEDAQALFAARDTSEAQAIYGDYAVSKSGFGQVSKHEEMGAERTFSISLSGPEWFHIIDDDQDLHDALTAYQGCQAVVARIRQGLPADGSAPERPKPQAVAKAEKLADPAQGSFDFGRGSGGRPGLKVVR